MADNTFTSPKEEVVEEIEVKTYRRVCKCPECLGELEWTGEELTSNPSWYTHKCYKGHRTNLRSRYPKIIYK